MNLPIVWNQDRGVWCVTDPSGKELWHTEKYSDAAAFAEDYAKQQQTAAQVINNVLQTAAVRG